MSKKIPLIDRLMSKVNKTDTCWLWTGQQTYNGYGTFVFRKTSKIKGQGAHRAVYRTLVGEIPEGLTLDHLCRVRLCVNPDHLEPVTMAENVRRSPRATSPTCKYGHFYKEQSPYYIKRGARRCHTCHATKQLNRGRIAI